MPSARSLAALASWASLCHLDATAGRDRSWLVRGMALVLAGAVISDGLMSPRLNAAEETTAPTRHTVQTAPFKVEVSIDGVLEAVQKSELILHPQEWASYKILRAVEHGSTVRKGDQLVWLDLKDLEEAIENQQAAVEQAEIDLKLAVIDAEQQKRSLPFDLELAEHSRKTAEQDFEDYQNTLAPLNRKQLAYMLKMSEQMVQYAKEELKQLEKMYKEDQITEETEEIILLRTRNDVEQAEFFAEQSRVNTRIREQRLDREDFQAQQTARQKQMEAERTKATAPLTVERSRLSVARARSSLEKAAERLAQLKSDLEQVKPIAAPTDGVVYYGQCVDGQWSAGLKFVQGESLLPHSVFMTVIQPAQLIIRAQIAEAQRGLLEPGLTGRASLSAEGTKPFLARIDSIAAVPNASKQFKAQLTPLQLPAAAVAGMSCHVKFVRVHKPQALAVPEKAVGYNSKAQSYVVVVGASGTQELRLVELGLSSGDNVQVISGLKAGDEILADAAQAGIEVP